MNTILLCCSFQCRVDFVFLCKVFFFFVFHIVFLLTQKKKTTKKIFARILNVRVVIYFYMQPTLLLFLLFFVVFNFRHIGANGLTVACNCCVLQIILFVYSVACLLVISCKENRVANVCVYVCVCQCERVCVCMHVCIWIRMVGKIC